MGSNETSELKTILAFRIVSSLSSVVEFLMKSVDYGISESFLIT